MAVHQDQESPTFGALSLTTQGWRGWQHGLPGWGWGLDDPLERKGWLCGLLEWEWGLLLVVVDC